MKIKTYDVISRAVDEGLTYGIGRLFKHDDTPLDEEQMRERGETLHSAIMGALCDVIEFDDEDLGVKDGDQGSA